MTAGFDDGDRADRVVQQIVIKASAERVFDALTDPQQRVRWWQAPGKFAVTQMESDLRRGGAWSMHGTGPEGKPFR